MKHFIDLNPNYLKLKRMKTNPEDKKTIAVWFSCGAASAVAAMLTIQKYKDTHRILIFNNPVLEEHQDNLRFKKEVSKWLGYNIIESFNQNYPNHSAEEIWKERKYMAGNGGAPCTMLLKKEARYQTELKYNIDFHVLGYTVEEKHRHDRFVKYEQPNLLPILIEANLTKNDCFNILNENGIKLPEIYKVLDHANCIGCVKASGVDYWQRIRKNFPEIFEKRAVLSRKINCKLVKYKGKRIFLDELPIEAKGRRSIRAECSIFCNIPKFKKNKS